MGFVWFIDGVVNNISSLVEYMGYSDSSEVISLTYLMMLTIIFSVIVLLFDLFLSKIKR